MFLLLLKGFQRRTESKKEDVHLLGKTTLPMSVPWDGTVCRIRPETNPFVA